MPSAKEKEAVELCVGIAAKAALETHDDGDEMLASTLATLQLAYQEVLRGAIKAGGVSPSKAKLIAAKHADHLQRRLGETS